MAPRPRKSGRKNWPENLYPNRVGRKTYYRYRHPITGAFHGMGSDFQKAAQAARVLNARLMEVKRSDQLVADVLGSDVPVSELARQFKEYLGQRRDRRGRALAEKTLGEYRRMVDAAVSRWADRETADITRRMVADFLREHPARTANVYRQVLRQMFAYAVAEGYRDDNPVEGTLKRDEVVERQRLTLEDFQAIRDLADPWFRNAMDLALQTLQRRADLVRMRFDDEREPGWLYVDQEKVEGHGTGHLRIRIGAELRAVIAHCRDDVACPFLIHRRPQRARREYLDAKDHPFQVEREMLTREFSRLRDLAGVGKELDPSQRPSFHEIRALGADLYRQAGHPEDAIQRLLGHSSAKMTQAYLDRRGLEVRYVDAEAGVSVERS